MMKRFTSLLVSTLLCNGTFATTMTATAPPAGSGFLAGVFTNEVLGSTAAPAETVSTRIVGGTAAITSRYPYFTRFQETSIDTPGLVLSCGGSLIRDNCVMTAAHCVGNYGFGMPTVYVNYTSVDDLRGVYDRPVSTIYIHPEYDHDTNNNDIALLFFDEPVLGVTPIGLNVDASIPADGQLTTAIGLGLTTEGGSSSSSLLQVDLPTVNIDQCISDYQNVLSFQSQINASTMLCSGYDATGGKGACQGDSGGPYIILGATPADDIQVGITSFGVGCAQKAFPDISTRVSFFNDWISCVLNGTCTDTNYSTRPPDSNNPAGSGDVYLPGPTAIVNVALTSDINPGDTTVLALNLCDGVKSFMLEGLQSANTEYTESLTVSNGGYIFATVDQSKDGFIGSGGVVFSSDGQVLYSIDSSVAFYIDAFVVVVGDGICTPKYLSSPNASIDVFLSTDDFPGETSLGYVNTCTGNQISILDVNSTNLDPLTLYQFSVDLSEGEYVFFIKDTEGDGLYPDGFWVVGADNVILYQNTTFFDFEDNSLLIIVGGGCGGSSSPVSASTPTTADNVPSSPVTVTPSPLNVSTPTSPMNSPVKKPSTNSTSSSGGGNVAPSNSLLPTSSGNRMSMHRVLMMTVIAFVPFFL